jgi:hypothetical protein
MIRLGVVLLVLAVITGCTSEPPATEQKPQPTELLSGRSAFQKLFIAAHGWAPDARPFQLQSRVIGDNNGKDGKAAIWSGSFASETQRSSKPYLWSGVDSPDAPSRGVSPGSKDSYVPNNVFDVNFLKIDSDKAYEVAQKHGGDKVGDNPVTYLLDWNRMGNNLIWHVIYGASRNEAKLVVDVDATTGEFIRKEK